MPLIDDQTRNNDRRSTARWPWVLVAAGLALLWLLFAVAISFAPRMMGNRQPPTPALAVRQFNSLQLQQAQQMSSFGQWRDAARAVQSIDGSLPMSVTDKHQYFRIGARSLVKTGSPLAGARFYDRFLSLSVHIHGAECKDCHNRTTQIAPLSLAGTKNSALGAGYTDALRAAGKLESTAKELRAALQKKPEDPRLHLLLYHVEKALKNHRAATGHVEWLADYDTKQVLKTSR